MYKVQIYVSKELCGDWETYSNQTTFSSASVAYAYYREKCKTFARLGFTGSVVCIDVEGENTISCNIGGETV